MKCKCGNEKDFFIEHNLSQRGLYCGECGKRQKWLSKDEERLFKRQNETPIIHDTKIRNNTLDEVAEKLQNFAQWLWDNHYLTQEAFTIRLVDMYLSDKGEQK